MRWLLVLVAVSGCVESNLVVCANGIVCPEDTTCNEALSLCVTPQQAEACLNTADGGSCDVTTAVEVCFLGVCIPSLCGDDITSPDEVCDDGNTLDGDACSARCDSTETCGNGTTDLTLGEDCDDGNFIEHDGCSSVCKVEAPRWFHRPLALTNRMRASAAYDSKGDRIIVLGGLGNKLLPQGVSSVSLDDVWEWDGRWREGTVQPPPPSDAFGTVLTYDAKNERMLRYSGYLSEPDTGAELWAFDGAAWTRLWKQTSVTDGPNVLNATAAYDPINDQLVVHGGYLYDGFTQTRTSATWFWSHASGAWSQQINTATGGISVPRSDAAMAFDPKRGRIVLYGGLSNSTVLNDLWELDNRTWSAGSLTGGPAVGRYAASLAWNTSCECLVLFGGALSTATTAVTNQTYTRAGTTWANLSVTSNPPPPRSFAALASDGHGRNVLVGGSRYTTTSSSDATAYFEDQWIFDGATWHEETGVRFSSATFDTDRRRVVIYGGDVITTAGEYDADTYELSEEGLRLRATGTPDAGRGAVVVYDQERRETILVGGDGTGGLNTMTYVWNGTRWATRGALPVALQKLFPSVVYDDARKEIVAFGGCFNDVCSDETWTWNGATWTKKAPPASPPARFLAAAGYDRVNQRVVLFGGQSSTTLLDTWTWDGTTWAPVVTAATPSGRSPLMAWDPARRKLVLLSGSYYDAWEWTGTAWTSLGNLGLRFAPAGAYAFSGLNGAGITYTGGQWAGAADTWELIWSSDHADDVCRLGEEHDGDGRASCADQDCWGVCTPSCLPDEVCDPAAARCGDGTCSDAESCRSCPADCTTCGAVCGDGRCDTGEICAGDCS